jgi:hypothetical protein
LFDPETSRWLVPVAFVCFALALVVLFSDFIFSDQMLRGGDTLNTGYMFRQYLLDYHAEHGSIPQWIPYYFGGMPYIEGFHGDIFYPLTLLKYFGELKRSLGWHLILHIFLAGLFMYFCARQFKLLKVPSLTAAAGYMFAAYLVSMVAPGHDGKTYVTALLPLVILFLDRGFETKPLLNFSLMGVAIGFGLLAPHAQMSYFTLWAAALYTLFKLVLLWKDTRSVKPLVKPGLFAVYAVVIGLALSAIQFYPGYIYTTNFSPRSEEKRGWDWATSWSMHEEEAMNLIIPEFSGTQSDKAETIYWGKNSFKDNCEAVGVVTFLVALLGVLFARRRAAWFFGGLALLALVYGLGATTPVFKLFFLLIPKVETLRAPSMIMFWFSFSAALLAAMALQRTITGREEESTAPSKAFTYVLWGYPAFLGLLALLFSMSGKGMLELWASLFYSEAATTIVQGSYTKLDVAFMNLPAIQSGAWIACLVSAVAAVCIWLYRERKAGLVILLAIPALVTLDGVRFNSRFVSLVEPQEFRARFESDPMATFLKRQPGEFRTQNLLASGLKDNTLPHFGLDIMVGYAGNHLRWYDALLGGVNLTNVYAVNPRVFNLIGVKYLVYGPQTIFRGGPDWFGEQPLSVAASFGQTHVLRNDNAFPRLFLSNAYRVRPDQKEIVNEVVNGTSDLRAAVLLEEQPTLDIPRSELGSDSAWFIDYDIESISIGLQVTDNRLLVMTDNWYDAWQVTVDGSPARLLRAYGSFRAVEVPAGAQRVDMVFRSSRYTTGQIVTWLTVIWLAGAIGGTILLDRRKAAGSAVRRVKDIETEDETAS